MQRAWILAAALSVPSPALADCGPADFELIKPAVRYEAGDSVFRVTGEVVNHCAQAAGVQLRVVQRGADDEVVGVDEFWPASVANIAAGESYPFDVVLEYRNPSDGKVKVSVMGAHSWND